MKRLFRCLSRLLYSSLHPNPRVLLGFSGASVAQIFNLLYRGFATRRAVAEAGAQENIEGLPIGNGRYGRVQLCATWVAVLVSCALSISPRLAAMPPAKAIDTFAEDYLAVREAHGFSQRLTMPEALLVQKSFVRKLQPKLGKPVGYKVGLVTREAQQRFGVDAPLRGVLLEKMLLPNHAEVPANFAVRPILEADLIVVVKDKAINDARSIPDVASHLKEVVAFIELPDSYIATNPPPTGALLAAGNVGARLGVLGQRLPVRDAAQIAQALANMQVTITDSDGAELGRGEGRVILDHPLNAVLWLMEELHQSGAKLQPGDLLSLGSIKAVPVPSGKSVTVKYDGLPGGPIEATARFR